MIPMTPAQEPYTQCSCPNPAWARLNRSGEGNITHRSWTGKHQQIERLRCPACTRDTASRTITLADLLGSTTPTAAEVGQLLATTSNFTVFIVDEFDKVSDETTKRSMADLIKIVSDTAPRTTLVIVGVADNIAQLIGEHPSIERNLVQIELPTMHDEEITEILRTGFDSLKIRTQPAIIARVAPLCDGYPHYAHLLGFSAAKACARNGTQKLTDHLFDVACSFAMEDTIERYRDACARATTTTQQSRYPLILCTCGFARHNEKGVFRVTDVVDAIRKEFSQNLTIQAVVPALGEFVGEARGHALTAVPVRKRQCYRFTDPMMRPFLRLKAGNSAECFKGLLPNKAVAADGGTAGVCDSVGQVQVSGGAAPAAEPVR